MATVTVEINDRPYSVGCADGQEARVHALAKEFDGYVRRVGSEVGQIGDIRLFLMAGLVLADEIHEARMGVPPMPSANGAPAADGVAEALNAVAARLEKIAQGL